MRAAAWSIVGGFLVGACSFSAPNEVPFSEDVPDAATPPDADHAGDGTTEIVPCDTPDPTGLVVCFELEDGVTDGMLYDSSPARRHATTSGLTEIERPLASATSRAAQVGGSSTTYVAQDPALELAAAYTSTAWVFPETLPEAGDVRGILDHELQYAMLIRGNAMGGLVTAHHCAHTGGESEWTEALPVGVWSFIACTWNGSQLCAYRWTSATSHEQWCRVVAPPASAGAQGLAIGHLSNAGAAHSQFDGKLDSVQVYSRGLTETQLCAMLELPANCM